MAGLVGVQPPLPQAGRAVRDTHQGAGADVAPRLMALPPALGDATAAGVLVARFAVHDGLDRSLGPHGGQAVGDVVAGVPGLAGLEVQPVGVLVLVIAVVRAIVDAGRLAVRVPGVDFAAAGLDLRLGAGPVGARQVDGRSGAVAGDQVAAV